MKLLRDVLLQSMMFGVGSSSVPLQAVQKKAKQPYISHSKKSSSSFPYPASGKDNSSLTTHPKGNLWKALSLPLLPWQKYENLLAKQQIFVAFSFRSGGNAGKKEWLATQRKGIKNRFCSKACGETILEGERQLLKLHFNKQLNVVRHTPELHSVRRKVVNFVSTTTICRTQRPVSYAAGKKKVIVTIWLVGGDEDPICCKRSKKQLDLLFFLFLQTSLWLAFFFARRLLCLAQAWRKFAQNKKARKYSMYCTVL